MDGVSTAASEHGPPRPDLSESLSAARARGFVGRAAEITTFAEALDGVSRDRVLCVHGHGGIGKTNLLDAFARLARKATGASSTSMPTTWRPLPQRSPR